jgi:cytochrome c peroxidase
MGMTLPGVVARLQATTFYADLFNEAFGTPEITSERMALAMAQFVRAIVSYQTKFDAGVPVNFANFTAQEELGREIFQGDRGRCSICHFTNIHISDRPHNIGLDATTTDEGVGGITGLPADDGAFKAPSLRNIAFTAPYMHDGRFATLEEVVTFYNDGVQPHPNLDFQMKNLDGTPRRLNLTATEQAALVAYMRTLSDAALLTDPKFTNPFLPLVPPLALPVTVQDVP